jgi:hypothetical protein
LTKITSFDAHCAVFSNLLPFHNGQDNVDFITEKGSKILEDVYNDTFYFIDNLKLYIFDEMSGLLCGDELDLLLLGEM